MSLTNVYGVITTEKFKMYIYLYYPWNLSLAFNSLLSSHSLCLHFYEVTEIESFAPSGFPTLCTSAVFWYQYFVGFFFVFYNYFIVWTLCVL